MMLYPPMADLVEKVGSRYMLVNVVANRARKLSAKAEEEGEPLDRKAVSCAIDEIYTGKLTVHARPEFGEAEEAAEPEAAEAAAETAEAEPEEIPAEESVTSEAPETL